MHLPLLLLSSLTLTLASNITSLTRRQSQICFIEPIGPNNIYMPCGGGSVLAGCTCCPDGVTPCASSNLLQNCEDSGSGYSVCVDTPSLVAGNCAASGLDTCQFADGSIGCCVPSYNTDGAVTTTAPASSAFTSVTAMSTGGSGSGSGGGSAPAATSTSASGATTSSGAVSRLAVPRVLSGGMIMFAAKLSLY